MAREWIYTSGKWNRDPNKKGIQTSEDYKFYAISVEFPEVNNKDNTLVFQFSVKREQKLDYDGGYKKLLSGDIDQKKFGGDTPYNIMFGPNICGYSTKKVHAILTYNGTNHLIKKEVPCETDQLTHVYIFVVPSDATYSTLIDNPEDWDDEENGEWTPSTIPNPEYKGPWNPKKIKNPNYKGKWKASIIDNPDFKDDLDLYVFKTYVPFPHCLFFNLFLHALFFKLSLNNQPFSSSVLINLYFKYFLAGKVLDEMTERDQVCYAAIIVTLAQNSKPIESLSLFAD
ncbi:hypothetical protein REPUB_Repub15cG0100300 [Reevesia pubescens]